MPDFFSSTPGAEQFLRFLEEKSSAGVFDYDLRTAKVRWSAGMFALFGIKEGSVEPTIELFRTFVHPQDRFGPDELQEYIANALPFERTSRIILHDGRTRWLSTTYEFLLDHTGKAIRMLGLSMDVTAQRARHVALIAAQERFRGMVMGVAPVVFMADADGKVTEVYGWDRLSGRPNNTALGNGWIEALHAEDRDAAARAWQARHGSPFFEHEFRLAGASGTVRWVRCFAVSNVNVAGSIEWSGMIVDLTCQRSEASAEAELPTGVQIRAARGMLKWSVADLSRASGVSPAVIRRLEEFDSTAPRAQDVLGRIRRTLEKAGVDLSFLPGHSPGVQLARPVTGNARRGLLEPPQGPLAPTRPLDGD